MALVCQTNSRIANANRSWQDICNVDVTDWPKANAFILSTWCSTTVNNDDASFKLQWRRVGGTFADVGADTEIRYTDSTVLTEGGLLSGDSAGCFTPWDSGKEAETGVAALVNIATGSYGEIQFGLAFGSGALDSQEYEFQLVCTTYSNSAICQTTIYTAEVATTYYQNVGQGSISPFGVLPRQTYKILGGYAVNSLGSLSRQIHKIVGNYAISSSGALVPSPFFYCMDVVLRFASLATPASVGSGVVNSANTLLKMSSKSMGGFISASTGTLNKCGYKNTGGYAVNSFGAIIKQGYKNTGGYSLPSTGILGTATIFLCAVGLYTLVIIGSLIKQTSKSVGGYATSISGALARQIYKTVGSFVMNITGTLQTAIMYIKAAGGYSMSIIGSLLKKTFKSAGAYTILSSGSLLKQTNKIVGSFALSITGSLIKKTSKAVGNYLLTISGNLAAAALLFILIGLGTVNSVGSLIKKTSKYLGGGVVDSLGSITKYTRTALGKASVLIEGILGASTDLAQSAGEGIVNITQSLIKKTIKYLGGGFVSSFGVLLKYTRISVGQASLLIQGILISSQLFFKTVGSGIVTITQALGTFFTAGGGIIALWWSSLRTKLRL